jgi:hypothetical protein
MKLIFVFVFYLMKMSRARGKVYYGTFQDAVATKNVFQRGGVIPVSTDEKSGEIFYCLGLDQKYLEWTDMAGGLELGHPPETEALRELDEESRGIFSYKITTCRDHEGMIKQTKNRTDAQNQTTMLISKESFNTFLTLYDNLSFVVFIKVNVDENDRDNIVQTFISRYSDSLDNSEKENVRLRWFTRDEIIQLCKNNNTGLSSSSRVRNDKNYVGGFALYKVTRFLLKDYCNYPKFGIDLCSNEIQNVEAVSGDFETKFGSLIKEMKKSSENESSLRNLLSDEMILDLNVPKIVSTPPMSGHNITNLIVSDEEALAWAKNCKEYITKKYRTEMMTFLGIAPSIVSKRITSVENLLRGNRKWSGRILLLFHTIAIERVLREYYNNGEIVFADRHIPILIHSIDSSTKIQILDEKMITPGIFSGIGETMNTKESVVIYRKVLHSKNPLSLEDEKLSDAYVWDKILETEQASSKEVDPVLSSKTETDITKKDQHKPSYKARWTILKSHFHLLGQPVLVFYRADLPAYQSSGLPSISSREPAELVPENLWKIVAKDTFPQIHFLHQHIGCHSQITPDNILFGRKRYTLTNIGGTTMEKVGKIGYRRNPSSITNFSNQIWHDGLIITPKDDLLEWIYTLNFIWLKSNGTLESKIKDSKINIPFHTPESYVARNISNDSPLYPLFVMIRDADTIDYSKIWNLISPEKNSL